MTDGLDRILRAARPERRPFLRHLAEKGAFTPPVISSFSMSGIQALHDPAPVPELDGGTVQPPAQRRRGRRWRRRRHAREADKSRTVSRRRLFGLLGGAAAAGAGLAVAGTGLQPDPAAAAPGNPLILGGVNDAGPNQTSLTSTGSPAFKVNNTVVSPSVTTLQANSSGTAVAASGNPAVAASSSMVAQLRLINPNGGAPHQPPSSGNQGDLYVNGSGELWFCTASGTPGTWVQLATPFVAITPTRVYDSRPGTAPLNSNPKAPIENGDTVDVDVTNNGSNVPATARAVVGNLTVVNAGGPLGSHLTVFPNGASVPGTSNINWGATPDNTIQVIANSFTSQVNTSSHLISVHCGGGSTDFLVDIFGYYA